MNISSEVFVNNGAVPRRYTCDGENVNPPLRFEDVPAGAESLTLIVEDPDAPAGTWVHWTLWNLSPDRTGIEEDSVPGEAAEGRTGFGEVGYNGPCPPDEESHRYFFKLYALDQMLELDPGNNPEALRDSMVGHILAEAQLIGIYR